MQREIKPEDVPQLMLEGKLRFGIELDCRPEFNGVAFFTGVSKNRQIVIENLMSQLIPVNRVRFPLPKLRDGDPVWINNNGVWEKAHFKEYEEKCHGIHYYAFHRSKWTNHVGGSYYAPDWRLPTKQELESAGYTEDQINEMMERWKVRC